MLWRGAVEGEPFLSGRTMVIAGDLKEKVVLYPIAREAAGRGRALINWAVWVRLGDGSAPPPRREDWSRPGRLEEVLPHFARRRFDWFDSPDNHISTIQTGDGFSISDEGVDQLVQAMAAFSPPSTGHTHLSHAVENALAPVLAANWQHS